MTPASLADVQSTGGVSSWFIFLELAAREPVRPARQAVNPPPASEGRIGSLQNLQPSRAHSRLIWPSYANLRGTGVADSPHEEEAMLWTICVILVIMWLLGMVSSYTLGGFLHLLLVLAIAVVLIRIIQGQRPI